MQLMRYLTAAAIIVALSLALVGCGSDKSDANKTSTSASTSTSTSTATTVVTSTTPGAQANKTLADYVQESHLQETPVHKGDPGAPNINIPIPAGWQAAESGGIYATFVLPGNANPADQPTISVLLSKLTGNVDQAKLLQYAPGEVQNLPGYQGTGNGSASTLSGFQAWQISGSYQREGKKRAVAQKTVVIPGQDAVFVLQLNANALDSDQGPLMDAMNAVDTQTTIAV
jgi:hypothetical protein